MYLNSGDGMVEPRPGRGLAPALGRVLHYMPIDYMAREVFIYGVKPY
jgi:hypothetical protein